MNKYEGNIEVLVHFYDKGKLRPFRIRLSDEYGESVVYNVKNVLEDRKDNTRIFTGNINIRNVTKQIRLEYKVPESEWSLYI